MARHLKVGKPDISPDALAHLRGIRKGNAKGNYEKQIGHTKDGKSTAARSTGINPKTHDPILPIMPNLSPA